MPLLHPRNFIVALLSLIAGNTHLSAFDIPVELPSGKIVHFDTEWLSVDPDSYIVSLKIPLEDPEELQIFSENPEILSLLSQSIQDKWKLNDIKFHLEEKTPFIPSNIISTEVSVIPTGSALKIEPISLYTPPKNEGLISCGGSTFTISTDSTSISDGKLLQLDFSWDSLTFTGSEAEIKNAPLEDERIDSIPEETDGSKLTENTEVSPVEENIKEKSTHYLNFSFSIHGNDFGGGWRLTPYELRFIRRQDNDLAELILLINSERSVLYKREYDYPVLTPSINTSKSLKDNLNGTYTLLVPSEGEFLFNSDGQLIQFIGIDETNTTYNYSGTKLVNILFNNEKIVSFEYSGDRVIDINTFSNKVHLEYDEKNFLCKIFDDQGSSFNFSYEDNEFDKITDETGSIVSFRHHLSDEVQIERQIPLIFNGDGEVFYYKNAQNPWKFSYRELESEESE